MRHALVFLCASLSFAGCAEKTTEAELPATTAEFLIQALPEASQNLALQEEEQFMQALQAISELPESLLWAVDHSHPLPREYHPDHLVDLDAYRGRLVLNRRGMQLSRYLLDDLIAMTEAAAEEAVTLDISSAYRSFSYQQNLYTRAVSLQGYEEASQEVALPGTSQHQLGTALDFGSITPAFADTPAGAWLAEHAWKYGFSLSYPRGYEWLTGYVYESWHYRYVGKPASRFIHRYFDGIQHYFLVYWLQNARISL